MRRIEEWNLYKEEMNQEPQELGNRIQAAIHVVEQNTKRFERKEKRRQFRVAFPVIRTVVLTCIVITVLILDIQKSYDRIYNSVVNDSSSACMISMVQVNSHYYTGINCDMLQDKQSLLGEELGTVELQLGEQKNPDYTLEDTVSTILGFGCKVYEWKGYATSFRVLGVDSSGYIHAFERSVRREEDGSFDAGTKIGDIVSIQSNITGVLLTDNQPNETGKIADTEILQRLAILLEDCEFLTASYDTSTIYDENVKRFEIQFRDGTSLNGAWNVSSDTAYMMSTFVMPQEVKEILLTGEIYSGGITYNSSSNGLFYDVDINLYYELYGNETQFNLDSMYINAIDKCLYLSPYLKFDNNGGMKILDGPISNLQNEGRRIWFLDASGNVVEMTWNCEEYQGTVYELEQSGDVEAIKKYLSQQIVYEGSYTMLRVNDGNCYTMDAAGSLYRNGRILVSGVRTFTLDKDAIIYCDATGIVRLTYDGTSKLLVETDTYAIATSGINVYYSPVDGGIYKLRINETEPQMLSSRKATSIVYIDRGNDVLGFLEADTKILYLLVDDAKLYPAREHVLDFGMAGNGSRFLTIEETDTGIDMVSFWYSPEDVLYLDPTYLSDPTVDQADIKIVEIQE